MVTCGSLLNIVRAKHMSLNQRVEGSSPPAPTNEIKYLRATAQNIRVNYPHHIHGEPAGGATRSRPRGPRLRSGRRWRAVALPESFRKRSRKAKLATCAKVSRMLAGKADPEATFVRGREQAKAAR